jgi:predicted DNA-binding protein (MmcQ/YjbR family)
MAATRTGTALARAAQALRRFALAYPEAWEDFPWGERVVKIGKKVFVFFGRSDGGLSLSLKLPSSALAALDLPFVKPTGYGLGKAGWVTASFAPGDRPPLGLLRWWIDESYRAVAPRQRVAAPAQTPPAGVSRRRRAAPRRPGRR